MGSATDGVDGFTMLNGASAVDVFVIGTSAYAIVAASDDNGVQLIDVSNPTGVPAIALGSAVDGLHGFSKLNGANSVHTYAINSSIYAIVSGGNDAGLEILRVYSDLYACSASPSDIHGYISETPYATMVSELGIVACAPGFVSCMETAFATCNKDVHRDFQLDSDWNWIWGDVVTTAFEYHGCVPALLPVPMFDILHDSNPGHITTVAS
eukprot:COSAG05_NODE_9357_length_629_cov_1.064151_1_plen_209_part_11